MAGMDLLERLRGSGYREHIEVFEHEPPSELVASVDILRVDHLGRNVIAVHAGTVPNSNVKLTTDERDTLVQHAPPRPRGYMNPGPFRFFPEGVVTGVHTIEQG